MPDTSVIYVPPSTWVNVRAFTNAGFNQRVTLTQEDGTVTTLTGSGEHDTPMPNGNFHINTPSSTASPLGYRITVKVESYHDGGWKPSNVSQGSCSVMYYHFEMVVSEDYIDADWNDAVVQFTWWVPPATRSAADFEARYAN